MSCTIVYPLMLLLSSCACTHEVQKEDKEALTNSIGHLNEEVRGAVLTSGEFQQCCLTSIQSELAELKSTVSSLKNKLEVTENKLEVTEERLKNQLEVTEERLKNKLEVTEEQLEQLRRNEKYKVAFAASLGVSGNTGPFNTEVTLVFKNVFVNTDKVYNPTTGIFTAPVKGIYFFSFGGIHHTSKPMCLYLFKNGQQMIATNNHALGNRYESASSSTILTLEEGDHVHVRLRVDTWVYDSQHNYPTFAGHLLFRL